MKRYGSKWRPRRCQRRVSERFKTAPFSNGFEFPRLTGSFRKLSLSCLFVSSESKREKEALLRSKKVCELTCLLEASWALWRPKCCCCARTAARHCAPVGYRVSLTEPNRRMHRSFHGACAQTDRLCVIERNCSAPGQVQGDAVCRPANIYTRRGRYERVDLRPSRTVNGRHHLPGPCSKSAVVYVSHGEGDRTRRSRADRLIQKASVMPVPAGGSRYAGRATSSSCL